MKEEKQNVCVENKDAKERDLEEEERGEERMMRTVDLLHEFFLERFGETQRRSVFCSK